MAIAWRVARVHGAMLGGFSRSVHAVADQKTEKIEAKEGGLLELLRRSEIELGKELTKVKKLLRAQKLPKSRR